MRYKAQHILVSENDDLEYIMEELSEGVSFEDLAREYSECPSADKGGHLGWFSSGSMDAEFEKALYHMKKGDVKSGIQTKFGFHIIKKLE